MKRAMKKIVLLLILLTAGLAQQSWAQPGGATPQDLFRQAADAMQRKDYEAFRKLFLLQKDQQPGEIEAMIGIMKIYPKIMAFRALGLQKFGDDFEYEIITGPCGLDLDFGVNWKLDFDAAKNCTFKEQDMYGERTAISTTRVDWEGFEKPLKNPATAVQRNGRWYMVLATKRTELLRALEKFIPEAQKFLEESKSASELAEKMESLKKHFDSFYSN